MIVNKSGMNPQWGCCDWYVTNEAEVSQIPVGLISTTVYVVNGALLYMSDGTQWVKQ